MRSIFNIYNRDGVTLAELIIATLLMSVVFLAVTALFVASQKFYFTSSNKIIASYELQYALDHIYKSAMQGIGDTASPAIPDPAGGETLTININTNDPLTRANYSSITTYTYYKSEDKLMFDDGSGNPAESMVPKITVDSVSFDLAGNTLRVSLTGTYRDEQLTLHTACYPRLASYQ